MIRLPPTPLDAFPVISDGPTKYLYSSDDLITPTGIVHTVDEAIDLDGDVQGFRYNFIDYRFDLEGGSVTARSYADEMDHVFIHLPDGMSLEQPDALRVLQYLARRYGEIRRFEAGGYVRVEVEETIVKPTP
jgi:hypothetical protein